MTTKVWVYAHDNTRNGRFFVKAPYNALLVERLRACLGLSWDKGSKVWEADGPEFLVDMQRYGIEIESMDGTARRLADEFRDNLWKILDIRAQSFDDELYGYQRQGSEFLAAQTGAILADDMGTGKSKQSLDAIMKLPKMPESVLVVCPKILCLNWLNECHKWLPPEYANDSGVVPDGITERAAFLKNPPRIVIVNYEKLLAKGWPSRYRARVVIFDEAHRLKNERTKIYKAAKRIVSESQYAWLLTGTPLEKSGIDIYALLRLIRPAVLGSFVRFRDKHLKINWAGEVIGVTNLPLLRDRVGPWILRRTKEEVLPLLPKKMPSTNILIDLSPSENASYNLMRRDFESWLNSRGVKGSTETLVRITRMRQFCSTPAIFNDAACGRGSKYAALKELILGNPESVFVVFNTFEETASYLREWLVNDVGYDPRAYISGKVDNPTRFAAVDDFNSGRLGRVFLSTDAGGMGINLTSADVVVHYDQIWNAQKMAQREDRLHRIGQRKVVHPVNLLLNHTIDLGIFKSNESEKELFKQVVDGTEEAMVRRLNPERLKKIIRGE